MDQYLAATIFFIVIFFPIEVKLFLNKLNLEPCDITKITIFRCKEYSEDVLSSLNDFRNIDAGNFNEC